MNLTSSPRFLRTVLWADAASCAATGLVQLLAGPALSSGFGVSPTLLTTTGIALLVVAGFGAFLATRRSIPRPGVLALMAGNVAWLLGCVELLFTGQAGTVPGQAWVVLQAVVVAVLAQLEWLGLRRSPAPAWA